MDVPPHGKGILARIDHEGLFRPEVVDRFMETPFHLGCEAPQDGEQRRGSMDFIEGHLRSFIANKNVPRKA